MKAILVIDVPDDFDTKTAIAIVDVKNEKGEGVTAMRPIKPMPNYIPTPYLFRQMQIAEGLQNSDGSVPVYSEDYMNGWNDCIEELEESETKSDLSTDEGWWKDYELYEMQND